MFSELEKNDYRDLYYILKQNRDCKRLSLIFFVLVLNFLQFVLYIFISMMAIMMFYDTDIFKYSYVLLNKLLQLAAGTGKIYLKTMLSVNITVTH